MKVARRLVYSCPHSASFSMTFQDSQAEKHPCSQKTSGGINKLPMSSPFRVSLEPQVFMILAKVAIPSVPYIYLRAFTLTLPSAQNALPPDLSIVSSLYWFKSQVKYHLLRNFLGPLVWKRPPNLPPSHAIVFFSLWHSSLWKDI